VLSVAVAVAGGVLTWQHWSDATTFDPATSRVFGVIVGIEFVAAGLVAAVLHVRRLPDLVPAWVALVVGVHLFPLAPLLRYPLLYVTAGLVTLGALVAVPVARSRSLPVSAVTGLATGTVLLATALVSLTTVVA